MSEDLDAKGMLPTGIEIVEEDRDNNSQQQEEERRASWEEEYGKDCSDLWCRPSDEWQEVKAVDSTNPDLSAKVQVRLMGNKARRLYPHAHVGLSCPEFLVEALQSERTPWHFILKEE